MYIYVFMSIHMIYIHICQCTKFSTHTCIYFTHVFICVYTYICFFKSILIHIYIKCTNIIYFHTYIFIFIHTYIFLKSICMYMYIECMITHFPEIEQQMNSQLRVWAHGVDFLFDTPRHWHLFTRPRRYGYIHIYIYIHIDSEDMRARTLFDTPRLWYLFTRPRRYGYIHIYIYIYIHIYIYVYTYIHIHIYRFRRYARTNSYTHIQIYVCTRFQAHARARTHAREYMLAAWVRICMYFTHEFICILHICVYSTHLCVFYTFVCILHLTALL